MNSIKSKTNPLDSGAKSKTMTKKLDQGVDYSITHGRSMCPHCKNQLSWRDLVPVVSWLSLKGRCRYCAKPIGAQYPAVELATSLLFGLSGMFWPTPASSAYQVAVFALWLALLTTLVALAVYDFKWMLLPNKLVVTAGIITATVVVLRIVNSWSFLPALQSLYGLLAFGGVFYVLFQVSSGKWIGGGDVKLGFALGAWLASPVLSFLAIFIASLAGTAYALIALGLQKITRDARIPFGPLLIAGFIIVAIWGDGLVDAYTNSVLEY